MWEGVVSGIISGVFTTALLAGAVAVWHFLFRTEPFVLYLTPSPPVGMLGDEFKYGVLHALNDDGQIVNRVHWFEHVDGAMKATIRHPRRIGFQYKCFVDIKLPVGQGIHLKAAIDLLTKAGFNGVGVGEGKPCRIWFLLPDHPAPKDKTGLQNNLFWPQ